MYHQEILSTLLTVFYWLAGFVQKRNLKLIKKIISGGQTGVDRAALDAAIKLTIAQANNKPSLAYSIFVNFCNTV